MAMQLAAALAVGTVAAALPAWRAARVRIVEGLRAVA
jgi:putative ABC transport system permease protein